MFSIIPWIIRLSNSLSITEELLPNLEFHYVVVVVAIAIWDGWMDGILGSMV